MLCDTKWAEEEEEDDDKEKHRIQKKMKLHVAAWAGSHGNKNVTKFITFDSKSCRLIFKSESKIALLTAIIFHACSVSSQYERRCDYVCSNLHGFQALNVALYCYFTCSFHSIHIHIHFVSFHFHWWWNSLIAKCNDCEFFPIILNFTSLRWKYLRAILEFVCIKHELVQAGGKKATTATRRIVNIYIGIWNRV